MLKIPEQSLSTSIFKYAIRFSIYGISDIDTLVHMEIGFETANIDRIVKMPMIFH